MARMMLERRMCVADVEVRESSSGFHLSGYASTFNEPYSMGWYTETVHPDAFKRTLGQKPDVVLLVNHGGLPLARTTSGTLLLDADKRGLRVSTDLEPSDPDVAAVVPKMRRGDLSKMSFGFRVMGDDGDSWSPDMSERMLRNLDLNDGDVSVVNSPANAGTDVSLRSDGKRLDAIESALRSLEARHATDEEVASFLTRALGFFAPHVPVVEPDETREPQIVDGPDVAELAALERLARAKRRIAVFGA